MEMAGAGQEQDQVGRAEARWEDINQIRGQMGQLLMLAKASRLQEEPLDDPMDILHCTAPHWTFKPTRTQCHSPEEEGSHDTQQPIESRLVKGLEIIHVPY